MTTWRNNNGTMTYAIGNAVATVKRDGSRYELEIKRNGLLIKEGRYTTLGGAQRMGELMVKTQ